MSTNEETNNFKSDFIRLDNSFSTLPEIFYSKVTPQPLSNTYLVSLNENLANELGINITVFQSKEGVEVFTGNKILASSIPISAVYSGHQFGQWAGQLGDGRAILLGDLKTNKGTFEIQLKGAGLTPYSRR